VIASIFGLSGLAIAGPAGADNETRCSVRHAKGSIRVVICPPGLDQEALRAAGEKACGEARMCNAWIWDDAEKAPKDAPAADADLEPQYVGEAVAVWANDSRSLMLIEAVAR
jgi:hypothetical protein